MSFIAVQNAQSLLCLLLKIKNDFCLLRVMAVVMRSTRCAVWNIFLFGQKKTKLNDVYIMLIKLITRLLTHPPVQISQLHPAGPCLVAPKKWGVFLNIANRGARGE